MRKKLLRTYGGVALSAIAILGCLQAPAQCIRTLLEEWTPELRAGCPHKGWQRDQRGGMVQVRCTELNCGWTTQIAAELEARMEDQKRAHEVECTQRLRRAWQQRKDETVLARDQLAKAQQAQQALQMRITMMAAEMERKVAEASRTLEAERRTATGREAELVRTLAVERAEKEALNARLTSLERRPTSPRRR